MKPKPLDLYDSDFSEKLIKEIARIQDEGADNIAERVIELIKQHIKSACEFFIKSIEKVKKEYQEYEEGENWAYWVIAGLDMAVDLFKQSFEDMFGDSDD